MTIVRKPTTGAGAMAPPKNAPFCREHPGSLMRYNGSTQKFHCPEKDCDVKATPKVTKESLRDVVLSGKLELVKVGDSFFLHLPEENVKVDVTAMVEDAGTGEVHGEENKYSIMLVFPGIIDLTNEVDNN